jgi:hypothetical protein
LEEFLVPSFSFLVLDLRERSRGLRGNVVVSTASAAHL